MGRAMMRVSYDALKVMLDLPDDAAVVAVCASDRKLVATQCIEVVVEHETLHRYPEFYELPIVKEVPAPMSK